MKKAFKIITTALSWLLLAAMIICIGGLLITRISGGEPTFFGYRIYVISTGSMEPTLMVGDVILSKNFKVGEDLNVGDIVTYNGSGQTEGLLVTHRLVSISGEAGSRTLILQGDANNIADNPISETEVVSVEKCKLTVFGKIYNIMQSKFGIPVLILIIIAFIIAESLDFSKLLKKNKETETQKKQ